MLQKRREEAVEETRIRLNEGCCFMHVRNNSKRKKGGCDFQGCYLFWRQ